MRERPQNPGEIIAESQARLLAITPTAQDVNSVLECAREGFLSYFSYASTVGVRSSVDQPQSATAEAENLGCAILFGLMARAAIFETLELLLNGEEFDETRAVDYTMAYVPLYSDIDGEHQFLTALVRLLDEGVVRFYAQTHSQVFRNALRETLERRTKAGWQKEQYVAPIEKPFDPWTISAPSLLETDTGQPSEYLRRTLRHNAETALVASIQIFPSSILEGYEDCYTTPPTLSVLELQLLYLQALPAIITSARVRNRYRIPSDPYFRQQNPSQSDEFRCELQQTGTWTFRWTDPRLNRPTSAGRCPAGAELESASPRERCTIARLRAFDSHFLDETTTISTTTMSTVEALFRVALVAAPELWANQMEANLLCPEFADYEDGKVTTIRNVLSRMTR